MITQIIDYRNAKYQGQTKSGAPHGIGTFSFLFKVSCSIIKIFLLSLNGKMVKSMAAVLSCSEIPKYSTAQYATIFLREFVHIT